MKKIYLLCVTMMCPLFVWAQDLDPTVEVSRVYEGKLIEVHKPAIAMAVPDTLYRFDQDFDYSVFESPYRGAYEFNPYMMDMTPVSHLRKPSQLYLRAGAGYTLHPVLDLLWSPDIKGAFSADVYAMHRSYVGPYRGIAGNEAINNGYDLLSKAGADFGLDWKKAALDFGASYYGVQVRDFMKTRAYNAVDAYASVKSKALWPKHFMYDVALKYRYAEDRSILKLSEHDFSLDATFGPSFNKNNKVFFDMGVEMNVYGRTSAASAARFYLVPHYIYDKGILHLDLGFRISAAMLKGVKTKNQIIYPDLHLNLAVIPEAMRLYVNVGGGEKLNSYASLIDSNHHLDLSYAMGDKLLLFTPTIERVSAELGLEGRISGFFSYNLRGGYVNCLTSPLDAALEVSSGRYLPYIGYSSYQKCYAALDMELDVQAFRLDGTVSYTHSWGIAGNMFAPAALYGDVEALYNWRKRIYAGVDCVFASSRSNSAGVKVPGYADLGVYAEYCFNDKASLWVRGGNLLNMEIQRNLFIAEKGINFTAGVTLSF